MWPSSLPRTSAHDPITTAVRPHRQRSAPGRGRRGVLERPDSGPRGVAIAGRWSFSQSTRVHAGVILGVVAKDDITVELVRGLVTEQFPQWAGLPIEPVELDGRDNTTFRLGVTMSVRVPSADAYAVQLEKEQRWLPLLAPQLPIPTPVPLALGRPSEA